ncbi:MAG: CCA tRNA nucleotidyltransferase [Hyphomonadaceae bacterium]|nr:CCA tRNA nucleotidyltransferase [Hyphomonadaceae bacterium]
MISIAHADWLKASATRAVIGALEAARPGGNRFVGGCVRNAVMGRAADDIDIATQLTPDEATKAAEAAGFVAVPTGVEHGTVTIVAAHTPFEVTTLRRDVETDGRRAVVAFTEDWAEDAMRRDFRLNALYAAPDGSVFDPTGGGIDDAKAGRVIFIGDADERIREDYLRILRFFRFNAWYGRGALDAAGLDACARMLAGLDGLSVERVWKETKKLLAAEDPRAALEAMEATGARGKALPELARGDRLLRLIGLETDYFLAHDAVRRLAAGVADQAAAAALAKRLKLANEERDRLIDALGAQERIVSFLSPREMRRAVYRAGLQAFEDRAMIAWAESGSAGAASQWRALLEMARTWPRPKFPLTGDEVMAAGAAAGPKVGAVLREVEAWWVDADFPDDKLAIVERLKAVVQGMA